MEKPTISIIVFGFLSIAVALCFHFKLKNLLLSSFLSALSASVLYQVIGFFVIGYLGPFFFIAFTNTLIISFFVSVIVGIPFSYFRKRAKTNSGD